MKRKTIIISSIAFLIPTVLFIVIAMFVLNQVDEVSYRQRQTKIQNYSELVKITPVNATVFFGDSITEFCPVSDIYANYVNETGVPVINRGISGETTAQMKERIEDNIIKIKPRNLVMLMGVNDLSQKVKKEDIVKNIEAMINITKAKCPNTNIILQAVYPVNITDQDLFFNKHQLKNRDNKTIKELNKLIEKLAVNENITFLDVTNELINDSGELKKEYSNDGLHLNTAGYLAIKDKIINELR